MDKLVLMRSLKLSDEDSIQLLITGIGSFALRTTVATLKTNLLNQFLREMQHITFTNGNPVNKSPRWNPNLKNLTITTIINNPEDLKTRRSIRLSQIRSAIAFTVTGRIIPRRNASNSRERKLRRSHNRTHPTTAISTVKEADKYTDNTVAMVASTNRRRTIFYG